MGRLKELKYFTLVLLLFGFIAAGTLSSCRDQKKKEDTEQADEHPTEEGSAGEEHPEGGEEHPEGGDEHPEGGDEHPEGGDEHPTKDSVSG